MFDQGKGKVVRVCGEFELSEFKLSRFYCSEDSMISLFILLLCITVFMTLVT